MAERQARLTSTPLGWYYSDPRLPFAMAYIQPKNDGSYVVWGPRPWAQKPADTFMDAVTQAMLYVEEAVNADHENDVRPVAAGERRQGM